MSKSVLITGAAGFIGFHLWQHLSVTHNVIALDNLSAISNLAIKKHRLTSLGINVKALKEQEETKIDIGQFYLADINDSNFLLEILAKHKIQSIIHLAAATGVRKSITHPEIYTEANTLGFNSILRCCKEAGIPNLIYASSSSVYGDDTPAPFKEEAPCNNPLSYYAVTKKNNELSAQSYASNFDMNIVGLRFFTVYGPWSRPDMANYLFTDAIVNNKPIKLFNSGNFKRDFTFVSDITTSIGLLLEKMSVKNYKNELFNIGFGSPILVKDYVKLLEELIGKPAILQMEKGDKEEMSVTYCDNTKLNNEIQFKPKVSIQEGLKKSTNWFHSYLKKYKNT